MILAAMAFVSIAALASTPQEQATLLKQVLYDGKQVDSELLIDLDVNGDGKVDLDDLVDLSAQIRDRTPPTPHARPSRVPVLIPRYADQAWWVSDKLKAATALKLRLDRLIDHDIEDWTRDVSTQLDLLNRDIAAADYYGLV